MAIRFSALVLPLLLILLPPSAQESRLHEQQQSTGNSHSRILPIEQQDNGYAIRFDTAFALDPDRLVTIVDSVMQMSGTPPRQSSRSHTP